MARPRLTRRLDEATDGLVTLVTAPAGWGKTVLISSWVRRATRPAAWLSIEPGDDHRLWPCLRAALAAAVDHDLGSCPELPALPPEPDETFLVQLADALAGLPEPLVLVVDNADHLHDTATLDGLAFLLGHTGARLRLVVATRAEPGLPLHRWRVSGELTELGTSELSFTAAETAELMGRHGLSLPDAQVGHLRHRTEGWPAGLRLAALALQAQPDGAVIAAEFGGDDQRVAEYLSREVLSPQPAAVQDALLRTSVLDWVTAGLVDTLTDRSDGDRVLSTLTHANAFVISRGFPPYSYRYHAIFAEFLRREVRVRYPDGWRELHRRAAGWLAANDFPGDALPHALAAGDWDHAAGLLATRWREMSAPGHHASGTPAAPPPADAIRGNPELALAYATTCLHSRQADAADRYLQLATDQLQLLTGDRQHQLRLILAALRLARVQLGGDASRVLSAASDLLAPHVLGPGADTLPLDTGARAIAQAALGSAQLDLGELDRAAHTLARGVADAEQAGLRCPQVTCTSRLALVHALRGELVRAARTAGAALELPPCAGHPPSAHCGPAYLATAIVYLHRDRLADAEPNLETAGGLCDAALDPVLAAAVTIVRAQLRHYQGDLHAAYATLLAARRQLNGRPVPGHLQRWLAVTEADLRTTHGDTGTVREMLAPLVREARQPSPEVSVAIARAHARDNDMGSVGRTLPAWRDAQATAMPLAVRLEAGLLDALAAHRLADHRRCTTALEHVLALAEPEGFRRVFTSTGTAVRDLLVRHLDCGTAYWPLVNDLVAASRDAGDRPAPPTTNLDEPLTERELTVLRFLQSILSITEIAAELHLSVNTVKTHLRNIYRKLDTNRRREAVRRGRDMRLI